MNKSNALILFVKVPEAGLVKTRLQPDISPVNACLLYRAMVEDLIDRLKNQPEFELILFFWPGERQQEISDWLGNEHRLESQKGDNLGDRMLDAFHWSSQQAYDKTVLIGSDLPDLDLLTVNCAFTKLDDSDVVLGPSSDGGYYLIGLKEPNPALFENVTWSSNQVFEETVQKINQQDLSFFELEIMSDLDRFEDVVSYYKKLKSGKGESCSRTAVFISKLITGKMKASCHGTG